MDPISEYLYQIGLGVASNAIYDFLKSHVGSSRQSVESGLENIIRMHNVNVTAHTIIEALATKGLLVIQGSNLYAPDGLVFGSTGQGTSIVGNNSRLATENTAIEAGHGAFIQTNGNAQIVQGSDGSIRFYAGPN